ncbi:MAG: hypothetical protein RR486_04450 [Clostridium sp.]|uniref:hypothetical protein n=1 Tax=Clostridium sp. TaxID=1506 RepID=UPI003052A291
MDNIEPLEILLWEEWISIRNMKRGLDIKGEIIIVGEYTMVDKNDVLNTLYKFY